MTLRLLYLSYCECVALTGLTPHFRTHMQEPAVLEIQEPPQEPPTASPSTTPPITPPTDETDEELPAYAPSDGAPVEPFEAFLDFECLVDTDCGDPTTSWCRAQADGAGGCLPTPGTSTYGGKCVTHKKKVGKPCTLENWYVQSIGLPGVLPCEVTKCVDALKCVPVSEDDPGYYSPLFGTCQPLEEHSEEGGATSAGCEWDLDCPENMWCRASGLDGGGCDFDRTAQLRTSIA